jgi:two-component system, chemotaxis family, sensor kinase Cph1
VAIVALTASAFDDSRDAIFAAGADGWLRKPGREAQLLDEIARLLGISYQHLAPRGRPVTPVLGTAAIEAEDGGRLPAETIAALRGAARLADYQRLCDLIHELPAQHAGLGEELLALVESFSYERIEVVLSAMA